MSYTWRSGDVPLGMLFPLSGQALIYRFLIGTYKVIDHRIWGTNFRGNNVIAPAEICCGGNSMEIGRSRSCELVKTLHCVVIYPAKIFHWQLITGYDYSVYGGRCHMEFT